MEIEEVRARHNILTSIEEIKKQIEMHIGVFMTTKRVPTLGDQKLLLECIIGTIKMAATQGLPDTHPTMRKSEDMADDPEYRQFVKSVIEFTNESVRGEYGFPVMAGVGEKIRNGRHQKA